MGGVIGTITDNAVGGWIVFWLILSHAGASGMTLSLTHGVENDFDD